MFQVKVLSKDGSVGPFFYHNVVRVEDCFADNGNFCHRIVDENGDTATFSASDWKFQVLKWVDMF